MTTIRHILKYRAECARLYALRSNRRECRAALRADYVRAQYYLADHMRRAAIAAAHSITRAGFSAVHPLGWKP